MGLLISQRIGLGIDPWAYLQKRDGGSHVLSVILLDSFDRCPKSPDQAFQPYFKDLVKQMPIGTLDKEYERLLGCHFS